MADSTAIRIWPEKAGASFTTVVDRENILGRLFDYKVIPNAFFVNEQGILVGKWINCAVDNPECIATVDAFRAGTLEPFDRRGSEKLGAAGAVGLVLAPLEQELYETRIRFGTLLAQAGRHEEAASEWYKALLTDPENFVLRKQVWRLRHPERFGETIDFAWQQEQLARERAEEDAMRPSKP